MSIQYDHHGRFRVAGGVVPDAVTAYCTYGDPKNPCMVFPTCYGGKLDSAWIYYAYMNYTGMFELWSSRPRVIHVAGFRPAKVLHHYCCALFERRGMLIFFDIFFR